MSRCVRRTAAWIRWVSLLLCSTALPAATAAPSPSADPELYRAKAAVVLELTRFVEWPSGTFPSPGAPFVIGVLGDRRFADALRREVADEKVQGRAVRTRNFRNLDEVDPCSILVVGREKARLLPVILDFLAGWSGVLTIGETADFAELGGVVRLVELPDRIGFEINRDAAVHADLRLGAQVLRLADRLLPERGEAAEP